MDELILRLEPRFELYVPGRDRVAGTELEMIRVALQKEKKDAHHLVGRLGSENCSKA